MKMIREQFPCDRDGFTRWDVKCAALCRQHDITGHGGGVLLRVEWWRLKNGVMFGRQDDKYFWIDTPKKEEQSSL